MRERGRERKRKRRREGWKGRTDDRQELPWYGF